ncbi:MAG: hypothetical protein IPO09_22155 [Anaeromyxobacter sp.]|nr:hypothetical protein [Anaeromyxobacter sp.]MBL0274534.1 hypothetical protein [Anaeromyxobacter sp.]
MTAAPRYKAALAALLVALPGVSLADKVAGATLPDDARRIGENRYQVARSYEDLLKHLRTAFPPAKHPRRPIADQPGVKAVHIENPDAKPGTWEGLNVYELKGEARIFVLVKPK